MLLFLEDFTRSHIRDRINRGHIDIFVTYKNVDNPVGTVRANLEVAKEYYDAAKQIGSELALGDELTLNSLIRLEGVIDYEEEQIDEALLKGIYQEALSKNNIACAVPEKEEYTKLRDCIEAVKQDKYTDEIRETFLDLVNRSDVCILGCTDLPILYEKYKDGVTCRKVYDPLVLGILKMKEEYDASR